MARAIERLYRLQVDASQANRQLKTINKNTSKIAGGFAGIQRAAGAAFGALGAIKGLTVLTKAYDQLELLEGSFEALTLSADRASDMVERVFRTVADTGASLEDTSSTFQRLTIGFQELGGTNAQIDKVANTFIKLGRVSGTSMFDTNQALIQFSQGLASGKLQGDELRSIMERLPLITRMIADEYSRVNDNMTVTRGMVKQLGREGKISAEIMGNALLRASEDTAEKFSNLVFTLEQEINSFKSTATQAFADLSEKTGIGEGMKAGVRVANQALKDFTKNVGTFNDDMKRAWEVSGAFRGIVIILAGAITRFLIPAIITATKAIVAFALSNPFTALALLATTAVFLIIKNWDKLKPFFLYQVPSWFFELQSKWYDMIGAMEVATKNGWYNIKNYFVDGINDVASVLNTAAVLINNSGLLGFGKLGFISSVGIDNAADAISSFGKQSTEALVRAMLAAEDYNLAMRGLGETASEIEDEITLFGKVEDPAALEKIATAMEKLKQKVLNTLDPFRKLNLEVVKLDTLVEKEMLSQDQVNRYIAEMDGTAEATRKAAEAWDKYVEAQKRVLDPTIAMREEFAKINRMWKEHNISLIEAGKLKQEYLDNMADELGKAERQVSALMTDLSKAGVSFIEDFSSGLVDTLLDSSASFSDFAASILEDLARMILRAVIFNSIMGALSGTSFGNWMGVPAPTAGSAGTTLPSLGGGIATGVISNPIGGKVAQAPVKITVNNNAPVEVKTSSSTNSNGGIDIGIMIEQQVNKSISEGAMDKSLQSSFGLSRRAF